MSNCSLIVESAPGEVPGLRGLIAANDTLTLDGTPDLNLIVLGQITLIGSIKVNETLTLQDPSLEQYAAAINSEQSLEVLFSKSVNILRHQPPTGREIETKLSFEEVLRPSGTNTKLDVLTLAVLVHSEGRAKLDGPGEKKGKTALEFILKYIKDSPGGRTDGFKVDFLGYDGHTALWHACTKGHWDAVKKLLEAGASFFAKQKNGYCPILQGLLGEKAAEFIKMILTPLEHGSGTTWLVYIARDVIWSDDLQPTERQSSETPNSDLLRDKLVKAGIRLPDDILNRVFEASNVPQPGLRVERPDVISKTPPPAAQVPPQLPSQCVEDGCLNTENLEKCDACGKQFCGDHIGSHPCTGTPS
jgi:hypothetical protein